MGEDKMKVLVTGGAGFIGSHTVERLLVEGCSVTVLDNLSSGLRTNVPEGVRFIQMDIIDKALYTVLEDEAFDGVIHLAGQTMVPVSLDKPKFDCQVNIMGTVNLLEACRRTGVKRIVFASTAAVYGDVAEVPVQEEATKSPQSFYGLSKLTVEQYLHMYQQVHGVEYVALRYANVYGERQGDGGEGGVVSIFTRKVAQGEALMVHGDGNQTRDFIYAGDIAAANYQALVTTTPNAVCNVGTQQETSVNELICLLEAAAGHSIAVTYVAPREGDIYRSCLANNRAQEVLDWKPKVSFAEGLEGTYRWLIKK